MGGDLSYTCLGNGNYHFRLVLYRDCAGIQMQTVGNLAFSSPTCGDFTATLTTSSPGIEVSPLCPASLPNSSCNGGPLPGVQQFILEGTIFVPGNCNDWTVSFNSGARNGLLTNITPSGFAIVATLDASIVPCNSSPVFSNNPVLYLCAGQPFCMNQGATDPDGDSLAYSLIPALNIPTSSVTYNLPYSALYPMGSLPGTFQFDSLSGTICLTPDAPQVGVVAIQVREYRNGVVIGTTMRDIQLIVRACSNQVPQIAAPGITNPSPQLVLLDTNTIEFCPGTPISFQITYFDPDSANVLTLSSNFSSLFPGGTYSQTGTNPIVVTYQWTPPLSWAGWYFFTTTATDNACPDIGSQVFTHRIHIFESANAGPDRVYCPSGIPPILYASGGSTYGWTTLSGDPAGLSCTTCPTPTATPSVTSVYEVTVGVSTGCQARDTVTVFVANSFFLSGVADTTICRNSLGNLSVSASPLIEGPFTYQWSPAQFTAFPNSASTAVNPLISTQYVVQVTSATGCVMYDTVEVTLNGKSPLVEIVEMDTLCEGIPYTLTGWATRGCDTTQLPCINPPILIAAGQNAIAGDSKDYGPTPYGTAFPLSFKRQFIYTQSELNGLGFQGPTKITSLGFFYTNVGVNNPSLSLQLGCTDTASWMIGPYSFIQQVTTVKNAFNFVPALGWNTVTFDFPYHWDGASNLVVTLCSNTPVSGNGGQIQYYCPGNNCGLSVDFGFNSGGCGLTSGNAVTCKPLLQLGGCFCLDPQNTYSWTPNTGLSHPDSNITQVTLNGPAVYTLSVADSMCPGSNLISLQTAPAFNVLAEPDTAACLNVPFPLSTVVQTGFGPYRYDWLPGPGYYSCDSCPNPILTPYGSGDFVVAITSADGCTMFDTVSVSLGGVAPIVSLPPTDTICPVGDLAQLSPSVGFNCGPNSVACSSPMQTLQSGFSINANSNFGPTFMVPGSNYTIRRQYIFTRQELDALGLAGGGSIRSLGLEVGIAGSPIGRMTISMACVPDTSFLNTTPSPFLNGAQLVKNPFTFTPVAGWNTFNLDIPYYWDGNSSLLVEFCTDTLQNGTSSTTMYSCFPSGNIKTVYVNLFNSVSACSAIDGVPTNCRPNMRFEVCQAIPPSYTYNWTPPNGLSSSTILNPTASPGVTTAYTLQVTDPSGCPGFATTTVVIDSTNTVQATAAPFAPCVGDLVALNALHSGGVAPQVLASCGVNGTPLLQPAVSQVVTGGTLGTTLTTPSPFQGQFWDFRAQYLFLASELAGAGVPSGTITQISWVVSTKSSTGVFNGYSIKMGCTNATGMSQITGWLPTTTVFGPSNLTTAAGTQNFVLSAPFDWDGVSNLVIEVCFNNAGAINSDRVQYSSNLPFNSTMTRGITGGTNDGCLLAPVNVLNIRPNTTFRVVPPPPNVLTYSWSPTSGLSNPSIPNPTFTFPGGSATYVVTVNGGKCPVTDTITLTECLPLDQDELVLKGRKMGDRALLEWHSSQPPGVVLFELSRGADGLAYTPLHTTPMVGAPNEVQEYTFWDDAPLAGTNAYKVRQIYQDGRASASNRVVLQFETPSGLVKVYPNPLPNGHSLHIDFLAGNVGDLDLQVTDLTGRVVAETTRAATLGLNQLDWKIPPIASGPHFLLVWFEGIRHTAQVMVLD